MRQRHGVEGAHFCMAAPVALESKWWGHPERCCVVSPKGAAVGWLHAPGAFGQFRYSISCAHGVTSPLKVLGSSLQGWGGGQGPPSPVSGDPIRARWVVGTGEQHVPHCPRAGCKVGPCSLGAPTTHSSLVSPSPGTHTVVAAPACLGVRRLCHLHGAVLLQVPHAAQAAVVVHPVADAAGKEALGCPHLADLTHLIIHDLRRDGQMLSAPVWAGVWLLDLDGGGC